MDASTLIGTTLDDTYEIEQKLGEGGMGTVFIARNVRLGKRYALKVLNPEVAQSYPQAVERFRREAKTAGNLGHVGIVQVHDIQQTSDGILYMVMDLLEGEDLETRMVETGILSWEAVYRIITQTCDALATAHEVGIVHRDLKPANIFLWRRRGEGERAVLLDFGVAKVLDAQRALPDDDSFGGHAPTPTLTKPGTIVGTPNYMSPEQASGIAVDHRADIYSMGAVLFHMCTGQAPFSADSLLAVLTMIAIDPVPLIHSVSPEANRPPELDEIIAKAMAKDPADRFQDVRSLAKALPPPQGAVGVSHPTRGDAGEAATIDGRPRPGTPLPKEPQQGPDKTTLHDGVAAKTKIETLPESAKELTPPKPRSRMLSWVLIGSLLVVGVLAGGIAALPRITGGGGGGTPEPEPPVKTVDAGPSKEALFSKGMTDLQQEFEGENWSGAAAILSNLSEEFPDREAVLRPLSERLEMEMEASALHRSAKAQVTTNEAGARQLCAQIQRQSAYRSRPPCDKLLEAPAPTADAGPPDASKVAQPNKPPVRPNRPSQRDFDREVDRIYRAGRGGARRCFDRAFDGGFRPVGTIRVAVRATIGSTGGVTSASLLDPRYRSKAAFKVCIENLVRSWQFPPSSSSTTREFLFSYQGQELDLGM